MKNRIKKSMDERNAVIKEINQAENEENSSDKLKQKNFASKNDKK